MSCKKKLISLLSLMIIATFMLSACDPDKMQLYINAKAGDKYHYNVTMKQISKTSVSEYETSISQKLLLIFLFVLMMSNQWRLRLNTHMTELGLKWILTTWNTTLIPTLTITMILVSYTKILLVSSLI